ncbi:MAG: hypothetical protein BJG00_004395 [Limnothrix sp. CACIAM 69d]|nr:MAG: hypothetical protein BJG00_004395 [Limnothrix sp. CACIAM 69d]
MAPGQTAAIASHAGFPTIEYGAAVAAVAVCQTTCCGLRDWLEGVESSFLYKTYLYKKIYIIEKIHTGSG